jgi:succinate dehydrogenase hydrophobic anchor subunit
MNFMRNPMAHYLALTGIFLTLILALPASQSILNTYDLTNTKYYILLFLYVMPFLGIWYAAFYAYTKLRQYAKSIEGSVEADGYRTLAKGCGWLAYGLPFTATAGLSLYTLGQTNPDFKPASIILTNYLNLIMLMIGFTIIAVSVRQLIRLTKTKIDSMVASKISALFLILGLVYGYVSLKEISLDSITSTQNEFFLPIWVIVISLIIPYLYIWFVGLLATFEMITYARNSKGLLYRQALSYVGYGITIVIAISITAQFLDSLAKSKGEMSINLAFASAFLIQLILAAGYILISIGANKLKRIEEV